MCKRARAEDTPLLSCCEFEVRFLVRASAGCKWQRQEATGVAALSTKLVNIRLWMPEIASSDPLVDPAINTDWPTMNNPCLFKYIMVILIILPVLVLVYYAVNETQSFTTINVLVRVDHRSRLMPNDRTVNEKKNESDEHNIKKG